MSNYIRYNYEKPGQFAWKIPFAFADNSQVGVNLIDDKGIESRLVYGDDYVISNNDVIYILGEGHSIVIWLNADPAKVLEQMAATTARQANQSVAEVVQAGPVAMSQEPVVQPVIQNDPALVNQLATQQATIDELAAKLASLQAEQSVAVMQARQAEADEQVFRLEETGDEKATQISEAADKASQTIENKTAVASASIEASAQSAMQDIEQKAQEAEQASQKAEDSANFATVSAEAAESQVEAAIARLEAKVAQLENEIDQASNTAQTKIAGVALASINEVDSASAQAVAEATQASRLAGQAWPQQGWCRQDAALPASSIMTLPGDLAYYPGRGSLYIAKNGLILTLGRDFEEVGNGLEISNTIHKSIMPPAKP